MMRHEVKEVTKAALLVVLAFAITPLAVWLDALALRLLWLWFVVPFGVVEIGMAHAVGLSVAVMAYTHRDTVPSDDSVTSKMVAVCVRPLFAMGFGGVVQWVMVSM